MQGVSPFTVNRAYGRSLLFDQMKKKESEPQAPESVAREKAAPAEAVQAPEVPPAKDKLEQNSIPFKPGFVFEYARGEGSGPIVITISDSEKIKVEHPGAELSEDRKRSIRSLVMLAVGKLDREGFNGLLREGKTAMSGIKDELKLMGLDPDLPFGLGDDFYYANAREELSPYRKMDVKG